MQAQVFVEELTSIYDNVIPCFPPSYKIFTVVFRQYHKQIDDVLYSIGCCTASLANNDILKAHPRLMSLKSWCHAHAATFVPHCPELVCLTCISAAPLSGRCAACSAPSQCSA